MKVISTKFKPFSAFRQLTPEKWGLGGTILAGKMIGLMVVLTAIVSIPGLFSSAHAAAAPAKPTEIETSMMNSIDTVWTLVAAFLVFAMQAGFVMLEVGFARKRETVNVLMECIFDTCLCGILFYAIGYAFMFSSGNGFIGYHWFFLQGTPDLYPGTGVPVIAHWIFQYAFADTCSTIVSGAMIGRTGFRGDILYSIGITGFIYPIVGHWAWGPDGFLALMGTPGHLFASLGQGFRDFVGSTVVHTIGGIASLAGAIVLGPRLGRVFKRDGGGMPAPHNLTVAAVGGFILWFGDTKGKFDLGYTINGFLAGLVAITCPCYWVSPLGAIILGAVAGLVVFVSVNLLEWLRIDDPIGAVSVHGLAGIWGTLSLGLFATGQFGATGPTGPDNSSPVAGLFYGGGASVFKAQLIGSATITIATFAIAFVLMWAVKQLRHPWNLRVEEEGEIMGLDLHEHGTEAYSEQETTQMSYLTSEES